MVQFRPQAHEVIAKVVYYGPPLGGKTTNLRTLYQGYPSGARGELVVVPTGGDRTIFFDFLPIFAGKLRQMDLRVQLYTVPGQVFYNSTRKLVLKGADGVVFVADSQVIMREQNNESFTNLKKNLKLNNLQFEKIPLIFQFNKRDLKEILPIAALNKDLNPDNKSFFPTVATTGENVLEGLHAIIKLVILYLKNQLSIFQKDKTVMFSREEITSSTPKPEKKEVALRDLAERSPAGDTEEEEVFELSSPMVDAEDSLKPIGEEDIFNLEDLQEVREDKSDMDIPEIEFADEHKDTDAFTAFAPAPARRGTDEDTGERPLRTTPAPAAPPAAPSVQIIDVPITVEVPDLPDGTQIRLNLKITLKSK